MITMLMENIKSHPTCNHHPMMVGLIVSEGREDVKAKKLGQSFTSFVECRVEFWLACNKWMQMQRVRSGPRREAAQQPNAGGRAEECKVGRGPAAECHK